MQNFMSGGGALAADGGATIGAGRGVTVGAGVITWAGGGGGGTKGPTGTGALAGAAPLRLVNSRTITITTAIAAPMPPRMM